MNFTRYPDRRSAGKALVHALAPLMQPDTVVLALPRGGVCVAVEIALAFDAPLDVFLVHKLAPAEMPDQIIGAVTSRGVCVLNRAVLQTAEIDPGALAEAIACERERVEEREDFYRGVHLSVAIQNRPVVVVTDGIANAITLRAAIAALRKQSPSWLMLAAPVGAPDLCEQLSSEVEELVCPLRPEPFFSIGLSYEQFPRVSDERVCDLLEEAAQTREKPADLDFSDIFSTSYLGGSRF